MTNRMTATEATTFDTYSVANAARVKAALPCGCEPYRDVFTYRRWLAQGQQVQRGQHAVKLPVIIAVERENDDGEIATARLLRTGAVFCRHQVAPVNAPHPTPTPAAASASTPRPAPIIPPTTPTPAPATRTGQIMTTWRSL